ncbi:sulfotransferase [Neiella marina]|uniref:Sulfotransferase n=1 Tax=Neiella holothuriorum TaxID=2870530 RepID=A0ABS7EH13_9GAMM|nr:sulfotransferase [Neiella holothuriorum]MBW8191626.1 sulfotransferase [Neiella holothuriorum]
MSPVFIMGTQRSGTTLLTRVLSAHPSIFIQNELDLPKVFANSSSNEAVINGIKKQLYIEAETDLNEKIGQQPDLLWGLKDPQLTEYIDVLRGFLPESKFIIIVRDGRGVTNSYMENKWGLGTNAYYGAQRWKREVEEQLAFMAERPGCFLFIRYEDLIDNLENELQKVCDFLGKDLSDKMLNYDQQASDFGKQRENINTFKKPDKKLAEKWKNRLSKFEINVVEHVAGDLLEQLGYARVGKKIALSWLHLFYFKWHQKIIGEIQIQYRWRKSVWQTKALYKEREKLLKRDAD